MIKPTILLVDDERDMLSVLEKYFRCKQYRVLCAESAEIALVLLVEHDVDLVLSDVAMPGIGGMGLLNWIRFNKTSLPIVMMTGVGNIKMAVEAIQDGAFHYITKPFELNELEDICARGVEFGRLQRHLSGPRGKDDEGVVVGKHSRLQNLMDDMARVTDSDVSILIEGETGTGKTLMARKIHAMSNRRDKPFYTIECSALTETLLESELFGHVRGAFTGALSARRGLLEQAQGGTIFLDEIGEISLATQAKLLHALQKREIRPVGANKGVSINVRFIAATNRNLQEEVLAGRFRSDLFYRLSVIPVTLPPLRERRDELPELIDFFIRRATQRYGKTVSKVDPAVLKHFMEASWPGNIRELENLIERAVLLSDGQIITLRSIGVALPGACPQSPEPVPLRTVMKEVERGAIREALKESKGSRTKAAKLLGISRRALYIKMSEHGLT